MDFEKEGFLHIKKGTISLFNTGIKDCDIEQSWNPILSDNIRKELDSLLQSVGAKFNPDIESWEFIEGEDDPFINWNGNSSVEFRLIENFIVPEHKERWDGESPFPEHVKESVEMPMFNVFDGGNGDGLVTIAEHKGKIVVEGTLWEKDGSINIWVKF